MIGCESEELESKIDVRISPNTFSGVLHIDLTLEEDSEENVVMYDLKGRVMSIIHNGILSAGIHQL